ncbi:MAG TPA: hypothetical protein VFQ60_00250 [Patescibacteria group bacterium]|nr:hypothetical protein [Patescibacteria group bacterium]
MTLQKVENNEATFTGTATITGIHFVSELDGNICFVPDASSLLKIPNLRKDPSGNQFCFTNQDGAKALLGVNNGKAAIVITGYRDWTIDTSQTPQTTLVQLAN